MQIKITPDGAVRAVYSDKLNGLQPRFSACEVQRFSTVEWEDGNWVARDARTQEKLAAHPLRAKVLEMEKELAQEYIERSSHIHDNKS